jgi:hypothetical protein
MPSFQARDVFRASEASFDDDETWITIVKEGESINGRNYKKNTLKQAVLQRRYENQRQFVDHSDGPPLKRSIKELVSGITETKYDDTHPDGRARIRGKVKWFNTEFQEFAQKAKEHIGVSHDARLAGTRTRVNGRIKEDIDEIVKVHSVDWVVYPSAGGGYDQFYATEGIEMPDAIDWGSVTLDMVEENAPDLATAFKEKYSTKAKESEGDDDDEDDDEEESGVKHTASKKNGTAVALDEKAIESIVTRVIEGVDKKKSEQAEVHGKIANLVNRSPLPQRTKNRIVASFDGATEFNEERVKESIEDAKTELKEAGAGPKVIGAGPSGKAKTGSLGRAHESLADAFSLKKTAKVGGDKDPDEEAE